MPHVHCSRQSNVSRLFYHSRMLDEVILYVEIILQLETNGKGRKISQQI